MTWVLILWASLGEGGIHHIEGFRSKAECEAAGHAVSVTHPLRSQPFVSFHCAAVAKAEGRP